MRLVSYSHEGHPGAGALDGDVVRPFDGIAALGADNLELILRGEVGASGSVLPLAEVRLRPVIPNPGKIICVGLNYRSHIEETGRALPTYPVLFTKFASSLTGPYEPVPVPAESSQVDYEAELAVVIGSRARRVSVRDAARHIGGYAVANDITMRDFQYKTHQWLQGKAWDNCTPLGPHLTTSGEFTAAQPVFEVQLSLNGEVVQSSDTSMLIFDVSTLISTVSEFTALEPGDVILTGTPGGVGYRRDPQVFLRPGDVVETSIGGLGSLRNEVREE